MGTDTLVIQSNLTPASESEVGQSPTSGAASTPSLNSRMNPRSCYSCHRRKVRCDKNVPCTACTRSGMTCVFPPSGPRVRRPNKSIMAEMTARIASLESSLAKTKDQANTPATTSISEPTSPAASAPTATVTHSSDISESSRDDDILVEQGSSSQYFNEVFLSRIIEEEQDIGSILSTSHASSPHSSISSPFNALGILSSPLLSQTPASFHPAKGIAVKLWKIYLENVEACAGLKLLHVPTDEVKVYSVINSPTTASFEDLALCLAIYFASTASLNNTEARFTLGQDKHSLLMSCKTGLEQAFAHGNFLDHPTLTDLHALVIYLSALRVSNRGKGIWILNGLAIRIAQSIGLHRDGKRFGLSPFRAEIRRRLWWHLISRESRSGEDYGLEATSSLSLRFDVSLPLNVDDTDLFPEMKELPTQKAGWTPMTFSLTTIEIAKAIQKLATVVASSSPTSPPIEEVRVRILNETTKCIDERLMHCNMVIPPQRMTVFCTRFLLRKLNFITKLQWSFLRRPGHREDFATEENLSEALELLAPILYKDDDLLKQFAWARRAYTQYHVAMYVLWHLCIRPEGPTVNRAWELIDDVFSSDAWDDSTGDLGSKPKILAALRAKALSIREKRREKNTGAVTGSSDCVVAKDGAEREDGGGLSALLMGGMNTEILDFEMSMEEWPNWAMSSQDFPAHDPGMFWQ